MASLHKSKLKFNSFLLALILHNKHTNSCSPMCVLFIVGFCFLVLLQPTQYAACQGSDVSCKETSIVLSNSQNHSSRSKYTYEDSSTSRLEVFGERRVVTNSVASWYELYKDSAEFLEDVERSKKQWAEKNCRVTLCQSLLPTEKFGSKSLNHLCVLDLPESVNTRATWPNMYLEYLIKSIKH